MTTFDAVEHDIKTLKPTGRIEHYGADTIVEAVEHCRYTHALKGPVTVGPTGLTVHCPSEGVSYAVIKSKSLA